MTIQVPEISRKERDRLQAGLERDLVAFYRQLEEDALGLLSQAAEKGWGIDRLAAELDALVNDGEEDLIASLSRAEMALLSLHDRQVRKESGEDDYVGG